MKLSKVVSFFLCVITLLNLSLPIANATQSSNSEIGEIIVNGTHAIYYYENSDYRYAVALNTENATGIFSVLYFSDKDYVYEYNFTVDSNNIAIHSIVFWQSIISDCMDASMNWVDIYLPSAVVFLDNIDNGVSTFASTSVEDSFVPLLEDYFDAEEYTGKIIATDYYNGMIFHLYEDFEFQIYARRKYIISEALSLLSLVTGLLGMNFASIILGGAGLGASLVLPPDTEVGTHTVGARWLRYVKKRDSGVWLTDASIHSISFDGFVIERTNYCGFATDTVDEWYSPHQAHFEDKHGQIDDGIAYYLTL